jgi:hypothetical protein
MSCHLATRDGILCNTQGRWLAKSGDLRDVSCQRCTRRLALEVDRQGQALTERRRLDAVTEAADFLGAGFVWSLVSHGHTATERMVREILAAVFIGLAEQFREERAA